MLIRCNARSIRLTIAHYVIMYIPNKGELWQIALNDSSDKEFQDFLKLYKDYTKEPRTILIFSERLQVCHQIYIIIKWLLLRKLKQLKAKLSKQSSVQFRQTN